MTAPWAAADIDRLTAAAITAELGERDRRRLLLGALPREVAAALPDHSRPGDQLRGDLTALARLDAKHRAAWLAQAEQLASILHPVEVHLFARYLHRREPGQGRAATSRGDRAPWPRAGARRRSRRKLEAVLTEMSEPLVIDFARVPRTASSFLDELLGRLAAAAFRARIRVTGMNPIVAGLAETVIAQRLEGIDPASLPTTHVASQP